MVISERRVKITVSNVVSEFSHQIFNPEDGVEFDIGLAYQEARSKLEVISILFPDGRLSRFIKRYQGDLFQLGRLFAVNTTKRLEL